MRDLRESSEARGTRPSRADGSPLDSGERHDRELIRRHLALSPRERLDALQSFVDDALKLRRGRPAQVR